MLRATLSAQRDMALHAIAKHFPKGVRITQPEGGYFLWLELPPGLNALVLQRLALSEKISIAPGQMLSADQRFSHCIRLNFGHPSAGQLEPALKILGKLVHALTKQIPEDLN
jgi:DNA-binding transcriptional MocR family regulator